MKEKRTEQARPKRGKHKCYNDEDMKQAYDKVKSGAMSLRAASKLYNVPRASLHERLKGKVTLGATAGRKPHLESVDERQLVEFANKRAALGIGFGKRQFLSYAAKLATKRKIPFSKGTPSQKWWLLMKKRNPDFVRRKPEATASYRYEHMNRENVNGYFNALKTVMDDNGFHFTPHLIWNMDETGMTLDPEPGDVYCQKGMRYVQSTSSGNRHPITLLATINAAGEALPPHFIFEGKTPKALLKFDSQSAPKSTQMSVSDSGWTKQGIATLWFQHTFLANIGPERPQLLTFDGHDSHCFVELIDMARKANIIFVELPAHTSHWLQPLDRAVFKPFTDAYKYECRELVGNYPGVKVSEQNFCGLVKKAWEKSITLRNMQAGFRACGIFPFNPKAIPDVAFLPNTLYATDEPREQRVDENASNDSVPHNMAHDNTEEPVPATSTPTRVLHEVEKHATEESSNTSQTTIANNTSENIGLSPNRSTNLRDEFEEFSLTSPIIRPKIDIDPGNTRPCPPALALSALECALPIGNVHKYRKAYLDGKDIPNDNMFRTWKKYKDAEAQREFDDEYQHEPNESDETENDKGVASNLQAEPVGPENGNVYKVHEELINQTSSITRTESTPPISLPSGSFYSRQKQKTRTRCMPSSTITRPPLTDISNTSMRDSDIFDFPIRSKGKKKVQSYFVLTSDEVYAKKVAAADAKKAKEAEKIQRAIDRKNKAEAKAKEKAEKATKSVRGRRKKN